jgi:gliding motility-associated lipoprotein GldD
MSKISTKYQVFSNRYLSFALYLLFITLYLSSCGSDSDDIQTPKPNAYFRIDFPVKKYTVFRDSCPYEFEYPSNYSLVLPDNDKNVEPCWKNIVFPQFRAEVHLTYKPLDNNLNKFLDESWTLATRHQVKASGMPETPIRRDSAKVYGLMFEIEGNAASSLQFYVTDSAHHFLRGALYFFARPNYDSLAPVIDFIKKDVERVITTIKWKEAAIFSGGTKIKHSDVANEKK